MDLERDELLISRVVDGDATDADWSEIEALAEARPAVWAELAAAIKAEALVRRVVDERLARIDAVELPFVESIDALPTPRRRAAGAMVTAIGWAAAALFAALWLWPAGNAAPSSVVDGSPAPRSAPDEHDRSGDPLEALTADAALVHYYDAGLREGRILSELPRVVLETRAIPDQEALEVLYVRRLLERQTVDRFYEMKHDELGGRVATPVSFDQLQRTRSL